MISASHRRSSVFQKRDPFEKDRTPVFLCSSQPQSRRQFLPVVTKCVVCMGLVTLRVQGFWLKKRLLTDSAVCRTIRRRAKAGKVRSTRRPYSADKTVKTEKHDTSSSATSGALGRPGSLTGRAATMVGNACSIRPVTRMDARDENRIHDRRSRQNLQSQPADDHSLLRLRTIARLSGSGFQVPPNSAGYPLPFHEGKRHPD